MSDLSTETYTAFRPLRLSCESEFQRPLEPPSPLLLLPLRRCSTSEL